MKLHLHIKRLVLPPGSAADPARLAAAVQDALSDMLSTTCPEALLSPDLAHGGARPAAPPVVVPDRPAAALPRTIARAVLTTLRGPT